MCLILVALMLLGSVSTIIIFLIAGNSPVYSASYTEPVMSIGIRYGDSAAGSFRTYSDTGYTLLSHNASGARSAVVIGNISEKTVISAPQGNLAPAGTGFSVASSGVTVGGYRVDVSQSYSTYAEAKTASDKLTSALSSKGYKAFPYYNGSHKVRVGAFKSESDAKAAISAVASASGKNAALGNISQTAVTLLTASGQILFEFDNGSSTFFAVRPAGSGDVYMRTDDNYIYEGAFMFRRSGNALTVINMIALETYIEGVLPYEISSSWHIEAQKAFAIAARSYAMGNIGKHSTSYGFDLCCTTNCQVYKGAGSVNSTVKEAVAETAGKILMYNSKVATLFYSSSTGGCTVSASDCWGGSGAEYLQGISTPWERYAEHSNGFWTVEVSPSELCEYLRTKGYTTLSGSIASVNVTERAKNSDYAKALKITDTSGNSVTITSSDKIRTSLSKYLKSANFVVGRGNVAYTVSKVTAGTETLPYNSQSMSSFNVITSGGKVSANLSGPVKIASGSGTVSSSKSYEYVITANNVNGNGDIVPGGYDTTYENKTAAASSSGNFIFVGKGWGHGVGLSQFGTKDLAEFNYTYDEILQMYVPAAKIKSVTDI